MKITGTCKFYNASKGYGFIKRDDNEPDVFFGRRALTTDVKIGPGDALTFDLGTDRKSGKECAENVELVDAGHPVQFGSDQPWID
jgi:cold shock protein